MRILRMRVLRKGIPVPASHTKAHGGKSKQEKPVNRNVADYSNRLAIFHSLWQIRSIWVV